MVQLAVFAGLPSSGKTSCIKWLASEASGDGQRPAYARVQCHASAAEPPPPGLSSPARTWVSGSLCPDHFLAERAVELGSWATQQGGAPLLLETAGWCARCSPFAQNVTGIFIADASMGCRALGKVGPMLATCDLCVLTRGDRV